MTFFPPDHDNPFTPLCTKHNFRGYNCPMCQAEEIGHYEQIKISAIDLSNKLEALLIACEVTEVKQLLPFLFNDAQKSLFNFKKLIKEK